MYSKDIEIVLSVLKDLVKHARGNIVSVKVRKILNNARNGKFILNNDDESRLRRVAMDILYALADKGYLDIERKAKTTFILRKGTKLWQDLLEKDVKEIIEEYLNIKVS